MGIPAIGSYPMPTEADLPANTAPWRVDPDRAALLIHDMQRYFLAPFPDNASPKRELVANVTRLARAARAAGVPVAYTAQPGGMTERERGLLKDFWGPGMAVAPEHREVIDPIRPADGDRVFTKWRYSAFRRNDLGEYLRAAGRDQLILCGVYAHVGVMITACDAYSDDIEAFLVGDAVADFTADYHRLALTWSAERCAVVATTETILSGLSRPVATTGRVSGQLA